MLKICPYLCLSGMNYFFKTGIIPAADAFSGFGHPAVITVGAILVVSRGLYNAGVIDLITQWLFRIKRPRLQTAGSVKSVAFQLSAEKGLP